MKTHLPETSEKNKNYLDHNQAVQEKIRKANYNLYRALTDDHVKRLLEGSGDELNYKLKCVNSSAVLALNVFSVLDEPNQLTINGVGTFEKYRIEERLPTLLQKNDDKNPAQIDVVLENDQTVAFVESKYTEHLRKNDDSKNEFNQSYFNKKCYVNQSFYQDIKPFLNQSYQYFNASQIVKHVIAIYRDVYQNPKKYEGKNIVLLNLVWEVKNTGQQFPYMFYRQCHMWQELNRFASRFNKRMKRAFESLGITFSFVYISYEDFILHHSNLKDIDEHQYDYVVNRYLFQKDKDVSHMDKLRNYLYSIATLDMAIEFIDYLKDKRIVSIYSSYNKEEQETIENSDATSAVILSNYQALDYQTKGVQSYLLVNVFNHYQKVTVIYLKEQTSSALKRIEDSLIWDDAILLEDIIFEEDKLTQDKKHIGIEVDGERITSIIKRDKEFYYHDFSRLSMQPLLFDEAKRQGKRFVMGFKVWIEDKEVIYYAKNAIGKNQLYLLFFHITSGYKEAFDKKEIDAIVREKNLNLDHIGVYLKGANNLYRYLKTSKQFSDYNIFPDDVIGRHFYNNLEFASFVLYIKEYIKKQPAHEQVALQEEFELFDRFNKFTLFFALKKLINYADLIQWDYKIYKTGSLIWNWLFDDKIQNKKWILVKEKIINGAINNNRQQVLINLLKGTFDDMPQITFLKKESHKVIEYVVDKFSQYRSTSTLSQVSFVLANDLAELIYLTPFIRIREIDDCLHRYNTKGQETQIQLNHNYNYKRFVNRITIGFVDGFTKFGNKLV